MYFLRNCIKLFVFGRKDLDYRMITLDQLRVALEYKVGVGNCFWRAFQVSEIFSSELWEALESPFIISFALFRWWIPSFKICANTMVVVGGGVLLTYKLRPLPDYVFRAGELSHPGGGRSDVDFAGGWRGNSIKRLCGELLIRQRMVNVNA